VILPYAIINQLLTWFGVANFNGAFPALLGGGFLFGAFFMATDPVSAAKTKAGRVIYGVIIAVAATIIRNFSIFNGGLMFSILLANMFAPIIDYGVTSYTNKKKAAIASEGSP
jgi:Na+-transporting NADH:ubiquinone oxidoreductase subunit B